jgi:hypothetical protein
MTGGESATESVSVKSSCWKLSKEYQSWIGIYVCKSQKNGRKHKALQSLSLGREKKKGRKLKQDIRVVLGLPLFHQAKMLHGSIHLPMSHSKTQVLSTISCEHQPIPILALEMTIKFAIQRIQFQYQKSKFQFWHIKSFQKAVFL